MAGVITATLVERGHNRLRYLIAATGVDAPTILTITTTGGVTPDLLTNSLAGPIKRCANAVASGLGKLATGAKTQAQARAIWLADSSDTVLGNGKVARCIVRLTPRDSLSATAWQVDANVDASGNPIVTVTASTIDGDAYLDVMAQGAIGI